MLVRFIKNANGRKKGDVLDVTGGVADVWLRQRKVERMVPPATLEVFVDRSSRKRRTTA
jgi:hypothetical protein